MRTISIRTITGCFDQENIGQSKKIDILFLELSSKYKVRTKRVALQPFNSNERKFQELLTYIGQSDLWFCIPFDFNTNIDYYGFAKQALKLENCFVNFIPTTPNKEILIKEILPISNFIRTIPQELGDICNFRVGVSVNCPPNIPFFPFTYQKDLFGFSIGLELAGFLYDLILQNNRKDLDYLQGAIFKELIDQLEKIQEDCIYASKKYNIPFLGIDISIVPFPYPLEEQSVAQIIELLGSMGRSRGDLPPEFGMSGSLFFNSFLSDILKKIVSDGRIKTIGFNGIMYSVLEDTYLCLRSRNYDWNTLLLLSATCGCGLDMIPLCEETTVEEIGGMILDVCSLALKCNKPLGVRVLPITKAREGDITNFHHLFMANSRIKSSRQGVSILKLPNERVKKIFKFLV